MTYTPKPLAELRTYFAAVTPRDAKYFSIARDCRTGSCAGYHLSKSQIFGPGGQGWRDYSIQHARDRAGLSDARSAIDINLSVTKLKALTAYLLAEGRAGRLNDVAEFIGPGPDGRAYDWRAPNWVRLGPRGKGDSHEWHCHVSFRRDSEQRPKVPIFVPHFGPDPNAPEEPVNPEAVMALQTLLNSIGARDPNGRELIVDGVYGPFTEHALNQAKINAPAELERLNATVQTLGEAELKRRTALEQIVTTAQTGLTVKVPTS